MFNRYSGSHVHALTGKYLGYTCTYDVDRKNGTISYVATVLADGHTPTRLHSTTFFDSTMDPEDALAPDINKKIDATDFGSL